MDNIEKAGEENKIPNSLPNISRKTSANNKARLFVEHYLQNNNATKAAELVGYKDPINAAKRLLQNKTIKHYVQSRSEELARQVTLSKPQFLARCERLYDQLKGEQNKIRLLQLTADVLGLTKADAQTTNVAIFQTLQDASRLFNTDKDIIDIQATKQSDIKTANEQTT